MKRCPVCSVDLAPVEYEGFKVMQCPVCKGHLVNSQRLDSIKRVDRKPRHELESDATEEFKGSTRDRVRCPTCKKLMRKQAIPLPVVDLNADVCTGCSLVWLDGGELALVQLAHEATSGFVNAQDLKRRVHELESSPVRKALFENNLARLPRASDPVKDILGEAADTLLGALFRGIRRSG